MHKKYCSVILAFLLVGSVNAGQVDHEHMGHSMQMKELSLPAKNTVQLKITKQELKNNKTVVQFTLTELRNGKPVGLEQLKEVHTEKVHLLIIDDSLEDYSHIHPLALKEPGLYEFEWSPKKQANYRVWADLFPLNSNTQEYVLTDLVSNKKPAAEINRKTLLNTQVDGYHFQLSFSDNQLIAGKAVMGTLLITDAEGKPVDKLEPIMGAFAHIVGFSDDWKTVVHIHPMGREPSNSRNRGGPTLEFHMEPEKAGFVKLFAQVRIAGKEIFVPFGFTVKAP